MEHKEFYRVTTTDDPVLEKLAVDGTGQVFITDTILAHLMTCTRSVYPWDIVVTKIPGNIFFFDKRDNSTFMHNPNQRRMNMVAMWRTIGVGSHDDQSKLSATNCQKGGS